MKQFCSRTKSKLEKWTRFCVKLFPYLQFLSRSTQEDIIVGIRSSIRSIIKDTDYGWRQVTDSDIHFKMLFD